MVNKGSAGGFGIGLLLGAAAGGILGILYAPHSGRVTRGLIDERVHDTTHKAGEIIEEAKDKAENIMKEARTKIGR